MDLDAQTIQVSRKLLSLSQAEVAERLGVTPLTYRRWERGQNHPQPFNQRKLYEIFEKVLPSLNVLPQEDTEQPPQQEKQATTPAQTAPQREQPTSPILDVASIPASLTGVATSEEIQRVPSVKPEVLVTNYLAPYVWFLSLKEHPTSEDRRNAIKQAIKDFDGMNNANKNYQISRREALHSLATFPMITLGLTAPRSIVPPNEYGGFLANCTASLEACWELYRSSDAGDTVLAFQSVSQYLPILQTIARDSLSYRREALDLATRYALLKTLLGWICVGPTRTTGYAKDAVALSKEAGDISLQLSAYSKLAWAHFWEKDYSLALEVAQEAQAHLQQYQKAPHAKLLHSSVLGGTYSTLALMQARNGHSADFALGKVVEADLGDESYAFLDLRRSNSLIETGQTYCYKGDQATAMATLSQRVDPETLAPKIPQSEMGRIETINIMTLSSLKRQNRDMEQSIHFWIAAIEGARGLKNRQCFIDAKNMHEMMEVVWPNEKRIADIRDHIVDWN